MADWSPHAPEHWYRYTRVEKWASLMARIVFEFLSFPSSLLAFFYTDRIHPAYGMTWWRTLVLALRIYRNTFCIWTLVSYKAHLVMAVKLLEIPPDVEGVVVECGCFRGGSSANLSLICDIVKRDLIIYDSFEGMPGPTTGDQFSSAQTAGQLAASQDMVRKAIGRYGVIERCQFRKGWFADTLPQHSEPIATVFIDVDYQSSLHECLINLWPHIVSNGLLFLDEFVLLDYCALFYSERYWARYFGEKPPGLIGAGAGVGVGHYYFGPPFETPPLQNAGSVAYTWKGNGAFWNYYPEDVAAGSDPEAPVVARGEARTASD